MIRIHTNDGPNKEYLISDGYTFDGVWDTMEKLPPGTKYLRFKRYNNTNVVIAVDTIVAIIESES